MRWRRLNRFVARSCGRVIRSSHVKARASIHAHGSIPALRMLALRDMSGTQTGTHFAPGWQWRGHPSKRFRKRRATSRSSCPPATATFPLRISCLWWSGSRLLPNSRSEELTFPGYWKMCRGTRAGVKALRPRSGALQRGLDSGPASAMLCLSGECHYPLWRYKPQSESPSNFFEVDRLRRDSLRSGFRFDCRRII